MNYDDLIIQFKNNSYAEHLFIKMSTFDSEQAFLEYYNSHNKADKTFLSRLNLPDSLSYQEMLSYINIYAKKDRHYPRMSKVDYCSDFFISQLHNAGYFSKSENVSVVLRHFYIPENSARFLFKQDYFQDNILDNIKALFDERETEQRYISDAKIYKKSKKDYFARILKIASSELIRHSMDPETAASVFKFLSKNTYTQNNNFVKNFPFLIESTDKQLDDVISLLFTSYKPKQRDTIHSEKILSGFSNELIIRQTLVFLNRYTDSYSNRQINPYIVPYLFNRGIAQKLYNINKLDSVFNAAISQLSNKNLMIMFDKDNEQKRNDFYKMVFNTNYSSNIKFEELYKKDPFFLKNEYFQKSSMHDFIAQFEDSMIELGIEFINKKQKIYFNTMQIFYNFLCEQNIDKENAIIRNVLLGFSRRHSTKQDMQTIERNFEEINSIMLDNFKINLMEKSLEKHLNLQSFTREYEKTFYTWLENNIIKFNMKDIKGESASPQRQRI